MHPPPFSAEHRLSDWPECWLELHCPCSPGTKLYPIRLLLQRHGDRRFGAVLIQLRCGACQGKPAPVYLVAGCHRTFCYGPPPNWCVELVPPPKPAPVRPAAPG